jgi:hypothetical protein
MSREEKESQEDAHVEEVYFFEQFLLMVLEFANHGVRARARPCAPPRSLLSVRGTGRPANLKLGSGWPSEWNPPFSSICQNFVSAVFPQSNSPLLSLRPLNKFTFHPQLLVACTSSHSHLHRRALISLHLFLPSVSIPNEHSGYASARRATAWSIHDVSEHPTVYADTIATCAAAAATTAKSHGYSSECEQLQPADVHPWRSATQCWQPTAIPATNASRCSPAG